MNELPRNEPERAGRMLDGMILLSTLLTAVGIRYDVAERQAGRDPSEEESPHTARSYVVDAQRELAELTMRLSVSSTVAASGEPDSMAASVRRFDGQITINQIARLSHGIHQRLLSLYPAVGEDIIEEVRSLTAQSRDLMEAPDQHFNTEVDLLLNHAFAVCTRLSEDVAE